MKTKLFLPLFAALYFSVPTAQAQYNNSYNGDNDEYLRNEFYAEYGVLSLHSVGIGIMNSMFAEIYETHEVITGTGVIGIGYKRYLSPIWTLGAVCNYSRIRSTYNHAPSLNSHYDLYTFLVQTDIRWVNRPGVQLYSGIGLGATIEKYSYEDPSRASSSSNSWIFNFQSTPLGIRVGKRIGGFLELGFGGSGMFCMGVSGKF